MLGGRYRADVHVFILWCGFFGGWLLVAGPVYQAALELGDQDLSRDDLQPAAAYTPPPKVSPWWWLLPPIGYWLQRRRSRLARREIMLYWTPEQRAGFVDFANRATGWMVVAMGAALIAAKETYELVENYEWPSWVFWPMAILMAALSAAHTVVRLRKTRMILQGADQ